MISLVIYLSTITCDGKMDNFKGSTCQVSCDPSYEINGDTEIECIGGGKNWNWDKDWPQCDPGTGKSLDNLVAKKDNRV